MSGAELPKKIPGELEPHWSRSAGESDLELPSSLPSWVAALGLWTSMNEPTYRLVARCFGNGREPEWPFLCQLLLHAGLVEPVSASDTFTFRHEWLPTLEGALAALGGADAARSKLVDAWLVTPELALVAEVAGWASDFARWDAVDEIWMALAERTGALSQEALLVFRDLPPAARRARPMLTWASGAAEALLSDPLRQEGEACMQRVLLDSVLHADWSARQDPDSAVTAGTIRMIGERRLPTSHADESLVAAWRTKKEIDEFIDTRSRLGRGPGRTTQAIFRAFSARLALFLGDSRRATSEARWGALLSDWEPVTVLAAGVEALARSISNDDGPLRSGTDRRAGVDDDLGVRGLKGMGQVYEILADGLDALRRLDRGEVDRMLSAISPEAAAIAGVWAIRVALTATRAAMWGDAGAGLKQLSADIARESIADREQDEPLGHAMLARARGVLLIKLGAFGAATQAAEKMPGNLKLMALARVYLWAGQYERAIRLADGGRFEADLNQGDQNQLKVIMAAAALLKGNCDDELRGEGLLELRRMVASEAFLPLALLPTPARDALTDLYFSEGPQDDAGFRLLIERLGMLNDARDDGIRGVHLTDREVILLPLLALDKSVPEIARGLHVSVNTVRKQVVTLRAKFGADTRAELIRKATSYGAIR